MAMSSKLKAGDDFPEITVTRSDGSAAVLGNPIGDADWQAVFVYRGKHCPLCTKFLNELETHKAALAEIGVEVIAVSGDSKAQLMAHMEQLTISFPIAYGLTEHQMKTLGLYISLPRSEQETDHNFAEPGLFVVNDAGKLQLVSLSNAPFIRPELAALVRGITRIRNPEHNYPIRGTLDYE